MKRGVECYVFKGEEGGALKRTMGSWGLGLVYLSPLTDLSLMNIQHCVFWPCLLLVQWSDVGDYKYKMDEIYGAKMIV